MRDAPCVGWVYLYIISTIFLYIWSFYLYIYNVFVVIYNFFDQFLLKIMELNYN